MSTTQPTGKNSPDATDDDVPPDIDSYAIEIPEAFLDAYAGATIAEKLRAAEQAPSTTGAHERRACPECGSTRVHVCQGYDDQQGVDAPFRCTNCGAHVEERVPPAIGARDDAQAGLGRFADD